MHGTKGIWFKSENQFYNNLFTVQIHVHVLLCISFSFKYVFNKRKAFSLPNTIKSSEIWWQILVDCKFFFKFLECNFIYSHLWSMDTDDLSKVVEDVKWDQRTPSISTKTEPLLPDLPFLTIPDLHFLHLQVSRKLSSCRFTVYQVYSLPYNLSRFIVYQVYSLSSFKINSLPDL